MVHCLAIKICLSDYVLLTRAIINNLEAASAGRVVAAARSSQTHAAFVVLGPENESRRNFAV